MSEEAVAEEIATSIADFRLGEIPPRTPSDIIRFVEQVQKVNKDWMGSAERLLFVSGLRDAIRKQYWSAARISLELTELMPMIRSRTSVARWAILSIQEQNSSQTLLVDQLQNSEVPVFPRVPDGFDGILYIDDATFTGRTLARYLEIIHQQISLLKRGPKELVIWHVCEYSADALGLLRPKVSMLQNLGLKVHFRHVEIFQRRDYLGRAHSALIPRKIHAEIPIVQRYLKSATPLKKIGESEFLWRERETLSDDPIFESPERRDVVERAFLVIGCWLRLNTQSWNHLMRPFGFVANASVESLGFGSMFCTYLNSSNTSPVALWWGDPRAENSALSNWEPLLPRRPQ
jgi:hypothetical protein